MIPIVWTCRDRTFTITTRPLVMGIVNATPDSFSDGGRFLDPAAAIGHGKTLLAEGADILDVGGESTRPGATPVAEADEIARVLPVVRALAAAGAVVSIDTSKAAVARACLDAGAAIVNDVTGLTGDPAMLGVVCEFRPGVVVMHMRGTPRTMQNDPTYSDVVAETSDYLAGRVRAAVDAGLPETCLAVDPGIGFGKTQEQTLTQLAELGAYSRFGRPVCLGVSRKGFLGILTGRDRANRLAATLAVSVAAGPAAHVWRVHDVAAHRDAAIILDALATHRPPSRA